MIELLNWDRIAEAVYSQEDSPSWDLEEVLTALGKIAKRFVPKDSEAIVKGVEAEFSYEHLGSFRRGFIDLWLGKPQGVKIVDWKTTGSITDAKIWRESRSDQPILYTHALLSQGVDPFPCHVEIRLVTRDGKIKVLPRFVTRDDVAALDFQQSAWEAQKQNLIQIQGVDNEWPRNYPEACSFGGRYVCQFIDYCERRTQARTDPALFEEATHLAARSSFSSLKEYKRCPERFRLLTWERACGSIKGESDEAAWGGAFHRGSAEIYRQIKEIQEEF